MQHQMSMTALLLHGLCPTMLPPQKFIRAINPMASCDASENETFPRQPRITIKPNSLRELVLANPKQSHEIVAIACMLHDGDVEQRTICKKLRTPGRGHDSNIREAIAMFEKLGWIIKHKPNHDSRSSPVTIEVTTVGLAILKAEINDFR